MQRSESKVKLLSGEDLIITESEGCSSGYDSASDVSDDDVVSVGKESATQHEDVNVTRVMRYSSTDTLANNLQIILSMPELCDVVFLVGDKQVPVYGVRSVLSIRSKVFNKLIVKAQQEQEMMKKKSKQKSNKKHVVIKVRKYQAEDFRKIINFIHCGKVEISKRSIAGLYIGAIQFAMSDLRTACTDYLSRKMKSGCAPDLINSAAFYTEHPSYLRFMETVMSIDSEKSSRSCKETQL